MLQQPGNLNPITKLRETVGSAELMGYDQLSPAYVFERQMHIADAKQLLGAAIDEANEYGDPAPSGNSIKIAEQQIERLVQILLKAVGTEPGRRLLIVPSVDEQGGIEINGHFVGELGCRITRISQDGDKTEIKRIEWNTGEPNTIFESS